MAATNEVIGMLGTLDSHLDKMEADFAAKMKIVRDATHAYREGLLLALNDGIAQAAFVSTISTPFEAKLQAIVDIVANDFTAWQLRSDAVGSAVPA